MKDRAENQFDSNTVLLYCRFMSESFSLEELSGRINAWCGEHGVIPASGQAGGIVSERNIRYYRTLGLMDAPEGGGYGEKHLLQLTAVRLLQAQGRPLRQIRELLYGRSLQELREIRRRGLAEAQRATAALRVTLPVSDELWRVIPLDEDFMLVSRRGTTLTRLQRDAVLSALQAGPAERKNQKTATE
jgi:DNA-binding transcriptional MerR regulator